MCMSNSWNPSIWILEKIETCSSARTGSNNSHLYAIEMTTEVDPSHQGLDEAVADLWVEVCFSYVLEEAIRISSSFNTNPLFHI